jgi:hypothetical protein
LAWATAVRPARFRAARVAARMRARARWTWVPPMDQRMLVGRRADCWATTAG